MVGSVPPLPYAAGPGSAPALFGPTLTAPASSIHAMLPRRSDHVYVDHRRLDRIIGDRSAGAEQRLAAPDERYGVGARAADVERHQIRVARG